MRAAGWRIVAAAWLIAAARAGAATFTVTTAADGADGVCDAHCTLREAVGAANASAGPDTVVLPAGLYGLSLAGGLEDGNASGDLDVSGDLTIVGAGTRGTVVDGGGL